LVFTGYGRITELVSLLVRATVLKIRSLLKRKNQ
jgi:hypothetical protein